MREKTEEPTARRRPHHGGTFWLLCASFLLAAIALGVGAWMAWRVAVFYAICVKSPEHVYVSDPVGQTSWFVTRAVPSLICAALSMICSVIALRSPAAWHVRLAISQFAMSCLAAILLLLCYWAAWGPVYYVTPPGGG